MTTASGWVRKFSLLLKKNWFVIFTIVVYVACTASYIGPGFYKCSDSIFGFGDSTAGPIWKNSLKPDQPILGGYENETNYPYGETLYSPVNYVSLIQSTFTTVASRLTNPVCGYNIYNIVGYVSTGLVMAAFVYCLTRSRWIALLAGYAVSFTPYVQAKVGGHPSYGYASLLIAIVWSAIHLITHRKKLHAVLLAVFLAACAYLDPYFILFAITIIIPILLVWGFIILKKTRHKVSFKWSNVTPFALAILVFGVLVAPILVTRVANANLITSSVSDVRGSVRAAALMCSNKPLDYLLPDPGNVYLNALFGPAYAIKDIAHRNWCGSGESRVSVSLIIVTIVVIGGIVLIWRSWRARGRRLVKFLPYEPTLIIGSVIGIGIFAFLLGLPPTVQGITTPSGLVLDVTSMWRIFAREYLLVNFAFVTLFAIILKYLSNILKRKRLILGIAFVFLFIGISAEYQINTPFVPPVFSYSRDVPQVYKKIENDKAIQTLAEYPLDETGIEHDSIVYYLTMQAVHGKKLMNSAVATTYNSPTFFSLKDLQDPQTLPVLRARGIGYVVIHGTKVNDIKKELPGVQVLADSDPESYSLAIVRADSDHDIVLAKILDGPKAQNILTINSGYDLNLPLMNEPIGMVYETSSNVVLGVVPVREGAKVNTDECFDIKLENSSAPTTLTLKINNKAEQELVLSNTYTSVKVSVWSGDIITVSNSVNQNMIINNLGCAE